MDERLDLAHLGLERAPFEDLAGGDAAANTGILHRLLAGSAPRGLVDTIALNAAAALMVAGRYRSLGEAIPEARELLLGGAVREWLARAQEFFRK